MKDVIAVEPRSKMELLTTALRSLSEIIRAIVPLILAFHGIR